MGRDPKALRGFYGELFGWGFRRASAFDYWLVDSGDRGVVGGIGPTATAGRPPLGGFATFKVEVVDPQTILAGAVELGGRTVMPATSVPGTDFKIAYFADPEGHVIGLTKGMA
ncbi:MAG: hypothetical protein J2P28_13120 [Actinobacteria bacterium]|nr:hypothetical protein [Actinomycetota bacterium]